MLVLNMLENAYYARGKSSLPSHFKKHYDMGEY